MAPALRAMTALVKFAAAVYVWRPNAASSPSPVTCIHDLHHDPHP
jgi:hypothetical protein